MSRKMLTGLCTGAIIGLGILTKTKKLTPAEKTLTKDGKYLPPTPNKNHTEPKLRLLPEQNGPRRYKEWLQPFMTEQKKKVEIYRNREYALKEAQKQSLKDNVQWAHRTNCGLNNRNNP